MTLRCSLSHKDSQPIVFGNPGDRTRCAGGVAFQPQVGPAAVGPRCRFSAGGVLAPPATALSYVNS